MAYQPKEINIFDKMRDRTATYCDTCGKRLEQERCDFYYNKHTGEQEWHYNIVCPSLIGRIFHKSYKCDFKGKEIIERY